MSGGRDRPCPFRYFSPKRGFRDRERSTVNKVLMDPVRIPTSWLTHAKIGVWCKTPRQVDPIPSPTKGCTRFDPSVGSQLWTLIRPILIQARPCHASFLYLAYDLEFTGCHYSRSKGAGSFEPHHRHTAFLLNFAICSFLLSFSSKRLSITTFVN